MSHAVEVRTYRRIYPLPERDVYTAECSGCGWIGETRVSAQRANRDRDEHLAGIRGVPAMCMDRPVGAP